jgi:hypothetical protein
MAEHEPEVDAALHELARQAQEGRPPHIPPEDLLAYHDGLLSAAESEPIRDHLAVCAACADLVLEMESFPDSPALAPDHQLSAAAVEQRWAMFQELRRRSGCSPEEVPGAGARQPRRGLPALPGLRLLAHPLTARLLAAGLALALGGVMLHQGLSRTSRPAVRVYVSSLDPQAQVREGGPAQPIRIPDWADRVLLILNLFELRSYGVYEVTLLADRGPGQVLWSSRDLHRSPDGSFALEVPRSFLSTGAYRIELYGIAGPRRDRLAVYHLVLELLES